MALLMDHEIVWVVGEVAGEKEYRIRMAGRAVRQKTRPSFGDCDRGQRRRARAPAYPDPQSAYPKYRSFRSSPLPRLCNVPTDGRGGVVAKDRALPLAIRQQAIHPQFDACPAHLVG